MIQHILIPDWLPATVNELLGHWAASNRRKRSDREIVAGYCLGLVNATGRRRVDLTLRLGRGKRVRDGDNCWKSLLDALVHAGQLTDDNLAGVQLGEVVQVRATAALPAGTLITLEDL